MLTLALTIIFVIVVFPILMMLAGTWLVVSAYDENSALRRLTSRIAVSWTSRRSAADLDRELARLTAAERTRTDSH